MIMPIIVPPPIIHGSIGTLPTQFVFFIKFVFELLLLIVAIVTVDMANYCFKTGEKIMGICSLILFLIVLALMIAVLFL